MKEMNRRQRQGWLGLVLPLLLVGTLLVANSVRAEENQATIAAFEALLSLPQTQPPEGGWDYSPPPGFVVEENNEEQVLISWLKKQKKMGADLNAVRHGGTMLHHAIRARMVDTVSWLLANGADPLKTVERDALELAIAYPQEEIFKILVKRPALVDPRRDGLYRAWKAVLENPQDGGLEKLIKVGVLLPEGKNRQLLLTDALGVGNVRLIKALTEANPDHALRAKTRSVDEDIEVADQRLPQPIFLSLIDKAGTSNEVDRLFQLRIRRPFDNAAFATQTVRRVLWWSLFRSAPTAVTIRTFERMPNIALAASFKDEEVLSMWWRWWSRLSARDRSIVMTRWGVLSLSDPEAFLKATIKGAYWFDQNEKNSDVAAAWGELLTRLRPPLPEGIQGKLWMFVPQTHRLALLQLGYRPSSEELRWWIDRNTPELIHAFWPKMLSIRPEIGRNSHELLFQPVAEGSVYYCLNRWSIEKALPLTSSALPPSRPYAMEAGCWYAMPEKIQQTLLSRRWVTPPPQVAKGRIVPNEQQCRFRPTPAWRRALSGVHSLATDEGDSLSVEAVMAVGVPNEKDCVLLAWGGNAGGRKFIDDDSFEGKRRLTPCADGDYAVAILRLKGEQIKATLQKDLPFPGFMAPIRDTNGGKDYWLGGNEGLGGCGQTPPVLFEFEATAGQAATLRALPTTHPTMQAILALCQSKDISECFSDSHSVSAADQRSYPDQGAGLATFADMHWNSERKAFVKAVLDFKLESLAAMKAEGVFPHWITDALSAVSKSSLSLDEKRRRAAWLFRDHALLRVALTTQMLDGLVEWLPREDWGVIIKEGPEHLNSLLYSAKTKGKKDLACRFSTALKQPCGRREE
ncbi:MAG: ankyrin repeat domain-containing protein [Betaproteobacteria bacterium]